MKNILFVDDEANILEGLQRMLRSMRREWDMAFAVGGAEALETLSARPFDVVITDMRMPGMNGAQLLGEVSKRHPHIVRIILSGYSDTDLILKSVGPAHQYLSKPCDPETIKTTVVRACALRDLLSNEGLQLLVSQMQSVPSLPSLYAELVKELESSDASIKKVGEVISRDVGMAPKILQMVNSAFFGVRRHISSPAEAVSLLGLDTVMTLVMTIQIFSQFDHSRLPGFLPNVLWSHSLRSGQFAKRIAHAEVGQSQVSNDAFTAGLLHEVGRLVLAANLPVEHTQTIEMVRDQDISHEEAERRVFGATQAEVGAYLIGLWGLPNSIVETLAYQNRPCECQTAGFGALAAVHVARALDCELQTPQMECCAESLDMNYLTQLGVVDRLPAWREICAQASEEE